MRAAAKDILRYLHYGSLWERTTSSRGSPQIAAAEYSYDDPLHPALLLGHRKPGATDRPWIRSASYPESRAVDLAGIGLVEKVEGTDVYCLTQAGATISRYVFGPAREPLFLRPVPARYRALAAAAVAAFEPIPPAGRNRPLKPRPWMAASAEECLEVLYVNSASWQDFLSAADGLLRERTRNEDMSSPPDGCDEDSYHRLFGRVIPLMRSLTEQGDPNAADEAICRLRSALEAEGDQGLTEALDAISRQAKQPEEGSGTYALLFEFATGWTPGGRRTVKLHRDIVATRNTPLPQPGTDGAEQAYRVS